MTYLSPDPQLLAISCRKLLDLVCEVTVLRLQRLHALLELGLLLTKGGDLPCGSGLHFMFRIFLQTHVPEGVSFRALLNPAFVVDVCTAGLVFTTARGGQERLKKGRQLPIGVRIVSAIETLLDGLKIESVFGRDYSRSRP